jgi:hypothetical protein
MLVNFVGALLAADGNVTRVNNNDMVATVIWWIDQCAQVCDGLDGS